MLRAFVAETDEVDAGEQGLPATEEHRRDGEMGVVDEAVREALADRGDTAPETVPYGCERHGWDLCGLCSYATKRRVKDNPRAD